MNTKSDHIWMAYLDNELDAAEISEFEDQASSEDIKRLEKEKKLETEISSNLAEVKCPEDVWKDIISDIDRIDNKRTMRLRFAFAAGIAALFVLSSVIVYDAVTRNDYPVLKQVTTLAALNQEVDISGDDLSRVESLLKSYGFDLKILPDPEKGHKIELLGAYPFKCCPEVKVVALCFSCCGEPVRLVVMNDGTDFVKDCECKCDEGKIQKLIKKGPYRIAVIGKHPADELLNLLVPNQENLNSSNDFNYNGKLVLK